MLLGQGTLFTAFAALLWLKMGGLKETALFQANLLLEYLTPTLNRQKSHSMEKDFVLSLLIFHPVPSTCTRRDLRV